LDVPGEWSRNGVGRVLSEQVDHHAEQFGVIEVSELVQQLPVSVERFDEVGREQAQISGTAGDLRLLLTSSSRRMFVTCI